MATNRCLRCGWTWWPHSEAKPKVCPKCKSYQWDKPREKEIAASGKKRR